MQKKNDRWLIVIVSMTIVALLSACNSSDDAAGALALAPAPGTEPAAPAYVSHEDQYYGYSLENGATDWLAWIGQRDGIMQIMKKTEQGIAAVYACTDPCKTVTVYEVAVNNPPKIVSTSHLPAASNMPAIMAMRDAAAGHLEQFVQLTSTGRGQLWVSPEEGPVVIPSQ